MRRTLLLAVALVTTTVMAMAGPASATIHPIVESFDCANEQAFEHHPLGDPADPPGQTPGYGSHSDQSTLRGFTESDEQAQFGHKLDGKCGKVGQ
jgi:hypothetical protein